jgi:hypothetical protein
MEFPHPAISGPSLRASISGDFLARFPVSRHSIGTVDFVGLNFGYAASPVIDDDQGMRFDREEKLRISGFRSILCK